MGDISSEDLEGITLKVYLYTAKKAKPVGPRDVMKGVNLSSPSVAYRHLQKLDEMEYLSKNEYGEYTIKKKARIKGKAWFGYKLVPKMRLYALLFLTILIVEIGIFIIHFSVETYEFKVFFTLLTLITGLAFIVFTVEDMIQNKQTKGIDTGE